LAARPGLAIINTLTQSASAGTAAEAAAWESAHGLVNVHVWADTADDVYYDFASQPSIGGGYPFTIVIDVDAMEMTYFEPGQIASASTAIQAILDAAHPCADY
jgi:hypothetical protein